MEEIEACAFEVDCGTCALFTKAMKREMPWRCDSWRERQQAAARRSRGWGAGPKSGVAWLTLSGTGPAPDSSREQGRTPGGQLAMIRNLPLDQYNEWGDPNE